MKIEQLRLTPDRLGRYAVTFSDGTQMRLYRQTMEDFGLCSGMELSPEEYDALMKNAQTLSARMRAVRITAAASVSCRDLENRLVQKGEDPGCAREAVQWLEDMHLLDDRKTAEQIVHSCVSRGYGAARARQMLYEKRIPKALWEEALEDYPDQNEKISSFLRTRVTDPNDPKQVKRAVDALLRRGHGYRAIRAALEECLMEADQFSEDM